MIAHIDLDSFFVSVARLADPALAGKKIAVVGGGDEEIFGGKSELGSVILSASYEARADGVHSAQPVKIALGLCPQLILVRARHGEYRKISREIYEFLLNFTPEIEKFSIDEFFLNLRGTPYDADALSFAAFLQSEIMRRFSLPCSVGLSEAKLIAKLATSLAKPFGVRQILKSQIARELSAVPVAKFPGIGKAAQKTLGKYGIVSFGDALRHREIFEKMGANGRKIFAALSGEDEGEVVSKRERKSIGFGRSFAPCADRDELRRKILILARHLAGEVLARGLKPTTYDLKIRYKSREEFSHQISQDRAFSLSLLSETALELFRLCDVKKGAQIIHVALNLSNFSGKSGSSLLFGEIDKKQQSLDRSLSRIWEKFGIEKLKKASEI